MDYCTKTEVGRLKLTRLLDHLLVYDLLNGLSEGWIDPLDLEGEVVRVDTSNI